jgi:hypothetical protein
MYSSTAGSQSRKCIGVVLSTLGLLVMACDGTVVSPESLEAPAFAEGGIHGPDMVPFKGHFVYFPTDEPPVPCGDGIEASHTSGAGNTSHAGKSVAVSVVTGCQYAFPILAVQTAGTVTGASGDATFSTGNLVFDVTAIGPDGVAPFTLTGDITGGTGRFEGAVGSYSGTGLLDPNTGSSTTSYEGTISSVGSLKP